MTKNRIASYQIFNNCMTLQDLQNFCFDHLANNHLVGKKRLALRLKSWKWRFLPPRTNHIVSHGTFWGDVPFQNARYASFLGAMHTTLYTSASSLLPLHSASKSSLHPSFPPSFLYHLKKHVKQKNSCHSKAIQNHYQPQKSHRTTISHNPKNHPKPPFVLVLRLQWLDANVLDQLLEVPEGCYQMGWWMRPNEVEEISWDCCLLELLKWNQKRNGVVNGVVSLLIIFMLPASYNSWKYVQPHCYQDIKQLEPCLQING